LRSVVRQFQVEDFLSALLLFWLLREIEGVFLQFGMEIFGYFAIKFGFILLINVGLYYVLEEVVVICLGRRLFNLV
jgi:hypothetical protein